MEALRRTIISLPDSEQKEQLLKELKAAQKNLDSADFRYKRTLMDKEAITNILNASITEIEIQKKIIEQAKNEMDRQKKLIEEQNAELNKLLANLKETQAQLIQSEKMASLGELTAGIAHEIQNPLNFVNNFSEVSVELIDELSENLKAGYTEEVFALTSELVGNMNKITHHGKRAESIVKNMLQHSRRNNGQKELTDVNALVDEFLRLSYHGLRAKDKSFNALMETDFDPAIGQLALLPQDIGRVLLNLFNNAFYSVQQKKSLKGAGFEPTVYVATKKSAEGVQIIVRDNGMGIPKKVFDKIYQPFFTTKPTGEGTGLGLSMSYDIITKGHGGTLNAKTQEGKFAEFNILLPS